MYILGISAFYHDSAAVLLKDGELICAFEEERFTRIKHDNSFPYKAISRCLKDTNISIADISYISYYEKPLLKFERILETFVETYPYSLIPFVKSIPDWLTNKIKVEHLIRKKLKYKGPVYFIPHHFSHAAACFYPSGFNNAAILTIDGVGEYQTTGLWLGNGIDIKMLNHIDFPHSIGLLYSTFTAFLGFQVNNDEYKMMGLSAYGKPIYKDRIYRLIEVKNDGSFRLDMDYFSFRQSFTMWSKKFVLLLGQPRKPADPIKQYHKDLASSIQEVTEEIYFQLLKYLYYLTKTNNLCISGGVALNALANGKIYHKTPFKNIYILGTAGDSAGALGSAFFTYRSILKKTKHRIINSLSLGNAYSTEEIRKILDESGIKYIEYKDRQKLIQDIARLLSKNYIIGWFTGRMEFGPRALGNRSILANPKHSFMKDKVNEVKLREQFRPFAGSVMQEKSSMLFDVPEKNHYSPFMNYCFQVNKNQQKNISAIVHKDGTCRIQTVNKENGLYYDLIKEFYRLTGIPCILNTSFNLKGEPIIENPKQAIDDFLKTKMDYLIIGSFITRRH